MTKFIYPTLDLFLYDLREGLGQTEAEVVQNRSQFWQKLPETLDKTAFIRLDEKYFEPEYVELLGEQRFSDFASDIYEGYYYPVRLGDTYGLLLDCSQKTVQSDADFTWLAYLQAYMIEKLKAQTGTLGQTWLFSAQLPDIPLAEYKTLAKRCYETLMPNAKFADPVCGEFLEGRLFEFWQYTGEERETHHVIIVFYPNQQVAQTAAKCNPDWLRLLMYRHKMMWAYHQSRLLKQRLKAGAIEIQTCNRAVSQNSIQSLNLKLLQETLHKAWEILPRYTTDLSGLDDQTRTIEINLDNYQKRLQTLEKNGGQQKLKLEQFSELVQNKYLRQVQKDHANLTPGLKLLENLIGYIQTMVAIEEEKRERSFQGTIATWGIGLAAGAIIASVSSQFPTDYETYVLTRPINTVLTEYLPSKWIAPSISIILSIGAALIAGLLTKMVIWWRK